MQGEDGERRVTLTDRGFPQELCRRIVGHVASTTDLVSLSCVCLEFQREVENRIYNTLRLPGPSHTIRMCKLLGSCPRVAAYVRQLWLQPSRTSLSRRSAHPLDATHHKHYIEAVANAFLNTASLEVLVFVDLDKVEAFPAALNPPDGTAARFQLEELRIRCRWGDNLVRFLNGQMKLACIIVADEMSIGTDSDLTALSTTRKDVEEVSSLGLASDAMPHLTTVHGPWVLAYNLAPGRPVVDMKTTLPQFSSVVQAEIFVFKFFKQLSASTGPIVYLDLVDSVPEAMATFVIRQATKFFPQLRYIGKLPLPRADHVEFLSYLIKLPHLRKLELGMSHFRPAPHPMTQAFTMQISMYAPAELEEIVFNMAWDFQRWIRHKNPEDSHDWILDDSGARHM